MLNVETMAPATSPPQAGVATVQSGPMAHGSFSKVLSEQMPGEASPGFEGMLADPQLLAFLNGQAVKGAVSGSIEPEALTVATTEAGTFFTAERPDQAGDSIALPTPEVNQATTKGLDTIVLTKPQVDSAQQTTLSASKPALENFPREAPSADLDIPELLNSSGQNKDSGHAGEKALKEATTRPVASREEVKIQELKQTEALGLKQALTLGQDVDEPVADSRFSKLLGKIAEPKQDLKQHAKLQTLRSATAEPEIRRVAEAEPGKINVGLDHSSDKGAEMTFVKVESVPVEQTPGQQAYQLHKSAEPLEPVGKIPIPPTILRLPSGQVIEERRVFDQIAGQIRTSASGDFGKTTLRLYPEELGEVKLDLTIENDRLRASLSAQTSQVQELLERYLPRLREALEQQGLRIESLQVNVDSQRGENGNWKQQQFSEQLMGRQQKTMHSHAPQQQTTDEPISIANRLGHNGQGLSLRI